MIKTLIIEDEEYIRKGLISMIEMLDKGLTIIGECASVQEAITVSKACKPDLVFLDINLADGNAFEFLEKTSQLAHRVIFTTAYEKYALQALKQGAIDYILKPVDLDELETAIDKALVSLSRKNTPETNPKQWNDDKDKLVLRLQDSLQIIDLKTLMFCKSDKGYTTFYLANGKSFVASKSLKDYEGQLPSATFVRTHQSYCVNLNYIDKYDKNGYVILRNGEAIPVSSRKKESFVALLLKAGIH
ncbi:LytR/AlgR family response regulator transcription factor [Microscilla marina]|uniref:Response regulator of the LytR/AlgR family, putative n=1 Tax=Microscilla marina ATCC 23134 TaxID=313606 RepID=A1ZFQ7_MICM2|nr:LytTR family DNA-binding domain-containing protein [Microscilla marina]EAY30831.1 response regulator of the LytR/AlgR family, putative [Microscilla marina ATCC 23134]